MHSMIYRFVVKPDHDEQFIKAWDEVTRAFLEHADAWGSRLHRADDHEFIAYAQWPSREVMDRASLPDDIKSGALIQMRDSCESIETLYQLTPVADHLKLNPITDG